MSNKKKIAFCGSDEIALPMLEFIQSSIEGAKIVSVLTQPDRRSGRGRKLQQNSIKAWASSNDLEISSPVKPGNEEIHLLQEMGIDLVLVMAYGHILSHQFLTLAPRGCYNLHASLLPSYRGASPIETSIACGGKETGVSLMRMVRRMDAGPVVDQERVVIDDQDTGSLLREKLSYACLPLIKRNISNLLSGKVAENEQEESQVSYCRKLQKEDAFLDFSLPAKLLVCRTRAFKHWPGSVFFHDEIPLRIGQCEASVDQDLAPGEIEVLENSQLRVGTGEGSLRIIEVQKPGGRMIPVADFLRGYSITDGSLLTYSSNLPLVSKNFT